LFALKAEKFWTIYAFTFPPCLDETLRRGKKTPITVWFDVHITHRAERGRVLVLI